MAEVAGLVIGSVSLAALFDTCMSCFDCIDTGRRYGKDYQKFAIAMRGLELRMSRWGDLARLEDPTTHITGEEEEHIRDLLGQVQADIEDAGRTTKRYNAALPADGSITLDNLAERFKRQARIRQHRTPVREIVKWALRDSKKCGRLVEDVERGIGELERVLPQIGPETQLARSAALEDAERLVQPVGSEEPGEPEAEPVIEILKEATVVDPVLQQVLEMVAEQASSSDEIRNIFTSDGARVALDDFVASGYTGPAPTERTRRRVIENVHSSGDARVQIGRTYGGRGVFDE